MPISGISPDNRNRGSGCHIVAAGPVLLTGHNTEILGNLFGLSLTNESAADGGTLSDTGDLKKVCPQKTKKKNPSPVKEMGLL